MKLNKTMGRVATTLVATAMLASVAVVPAFADEPCNVTITTQTITKDADAKTMPTDLNSLSRSVRSLLGK